MDFQSVAIQLCFFSLLNEMYPLYKPWTDAFKPSQWTKNRAAELMVKGLRASPMTWTRWLVQILMTFNIAFPQDAFKPTWRTENLGTADKWRAAGLHLTQTRTQSKTMLKHSWLWSVVGGRVEHRSVPLSHEAVALSLKHFLNFSEYESKIYS